MGACLSAYSDEMVDMLATAKVITIDGSLREYSVPTKVSEILDEMNSTASFLSSSDELYLGSYIPALSSRDWVELDQIYFVLPRSMVDQPLKGHDMAALAVMASIALDGALAKKRSGSGGKRDIQVMPIYELDENLDQTYKIDNDLKKTEQIRSKSALLRNSKTKLGGRASVRDRHNMPRLIAIQEVAE